MDHNVSFVNAVQRGMMVSLKTIPKLSIRFTTLLMAVLISIKIERVSKTSVSTNTIFESMLNIPFLQQVMENQPVMALEGQLSALFARQVFSYQMKNKLSVQLLYLIFVKPI